MNQLEALEAKQAEVIKQLKGIRSLRKGSLNEQWTPVIRNGKKTEQLRGPYYVWSYKKGAKTVSERIRGDANIKRAQKDMQNYRRFKALCQELEEIIAQIGEAERKQNQSTEALKKGLKSKSKRAPK